MVDVNLGEQLDAVVEQLVLSGRYGSPAEVLREGVRLVQEREAHLRAIEAGLMVGPEPARFGRMTPTSRVSFQGKQSEHLMTLPHE